MLRAIPSLTQRTSPTHYPKTIMKTTRATRAVKPAKKASRNATPRVVGPGQAQGRGSLLLLLLPADSGKEVTPRRAEGQMGRPLFLSQGQHARLHARGHRLRGAAAALKAARRGGPRREPRFDRQPLRLQGKAGSALSALVRPRFRGPQTLRRLRRQDDVRKKDHRRSAHDGAHRGPTASWRGSSRT